MKTFIVLGMHRSATSLVGKGLAENGVHVGDKLMPANGGNRYGYWEDVDFVRINNKILGWAGGSWKSPPEEKAILEYNKKFPNEIKRLIERKEREPMWGWKDPRTTLTIKLFMPYLKNPHFIVCFREPKEVAASLIRTEKVPIARGIKLAQTYNERLLNFMKEWHENPERYSSGE